MSWGLFLTVVAQVLITTVVLFFLSALAAAVWGPARKPPVRKQPCPCCRRVHDPMPSNPTRGDEKP